MKFEYREQLGFSETIEADSLDAAMEQARKMLRAGDWPEVEDGETLRATLAELDDDGVQIDTRNVSAIK